MFATDRRTQGAVFVAVGALVVGLAWLGIVGTGVIPVTGGLRLVSFALVTTILLGVNVWLAWSALHRLLKGDEEPPEYFHHGPFKSRQRGLRR